MTKYDNETRSKAEVYILENDIKLPRSFKKRWLEALRNGKYKRTTSVLVKFRADGETPRGFCCLGVAAHIQGAPLKELSKHAFIEPSIKNTTKRAIPECLIERNGGNPITRWLAIYNDQDTSKKGFKPIANWIEKNL